MKHVEGEVKQTDESDCVDLSRRAKGFRYYSESDEKPVTESELGSDIL